jgi:MFS family permease
MAIVMMLMGMAQNIWQFLMLRAARPAGRLYSQRQCPDRHPDPRHKSGWALGTLSTGAVSGALLGPLAGGFLADHWGLRTVFFMTAACCLSVSCLPCFSSAKILSRQKRDAQRERFSRRKIRNWC